MWPFKKKVTGGREYSPPGAYKIEAGQLTKPSISMFGSMLSGDTNMNIVSRRNVIFDCDVSRLKRYTADQLLRNLPAINPDASMALWNMLRLCSAPVKFKVTDLSGRATDKGYQLIWEYVNRIYRDRGGFAAFEGQLFKTVYVLGAACGETVLGADLKELLDFVAVDPTTIDFFARKLPNGQINYVPKQLQSGQYVSVEKEGFYYVPLDADIGDPYGSSPLLSLLQVMFFQMQVMADLQRITHNQGWPRLHVKVLTEILMKNAPPALQRNEGKLQNFIKNQLSDIQTIYQSLEPDDTFVTTDATDISEVGGKSGASASAKTLMDVIDIRMANGLKQLSIFLNKHSGKTETYGTVEWKIMVDAIESVRQVVKQVIDNGLTFILNQNGIQGYVEREYEAISTENLLTKETAEWLRTKRLTFARDAGLIGHDHTAQILFGLDEAEGEEVPLNVPKAFSSMGSDVGQVKSLVEMGTELLSRRLSEGEDRAVDVDTYKDGKQGIKFAKIAQMETAYKRELNTAFKGTRQEVIDAIMQDLELE